MPTQSSSSASTATTARTRASLACQNCRQRKIKCDAQELEVGFSCTPCHSSNVPCVFDPNGDRRRLGSRRQIEALKERIEILEAAIEQQSNQTVAEFSVDENQGHQFQPLLSPGLTLSDGSLQTCLSSEHRSAESHADRRPTSERHQCAPTLPSQSQELLHSNTETGPLPFSTFQSTDSRLFDAAESNTTDGSRPEMIRHSEINPVRRSTSEEPRASKSQSPEEAAFFGSTSQPHVWSPGHQDSVQTFNESGISSEESIALGVAVDMHSAQLRIHLLRTYFKYESLWLSVVHKGVFMAHRAKGVQSQWYSKFLESVLLACAARLSTSSAVRALSHEYAKEARAGILSALENPSCASLQGFLMLSEFEVTLGNDRIGWMLCGMACRLISDLGLHQRMEAVSRSTPEDNSIPTDESLFFSLLCASVSFEGIWCLYLGRPSSIPKSIIDAALEQCKKTQLPSLRMAVAWVGLCHPMAEINELLNNSSQSDSSSCNRLHELQGELQRWHDSLPPGVFLDDNCLTDLDATAYGLHMQHAKVQILLHQSHKFRSSTRKRKLSQTGFQDRQESPLQDESAAIIYTNALRIAKLLLTYRQLFGTEKISSIMLDNANLAATSLISHLLNHTVTKVVDENKKHWLQSILNTLEAVQSHFPITKRMIQTLKLMVENTRLAGIFDAPAPASSRNRSSSISLSQRGSYATGDYLANASVWDFDYPSWQPPEAGHTKSAVPFGSGYPDDTQASPPERDLTQQEVTDLAASVLSCSDMGFLPLFHVASCSQ